MNYHKIRWFFVGATLVASTLTALAAERVNVNTTPGSGLLLAASNLPVQEIDTAIRTTFSVTEVSANAVYINGGMDAGLQPGMTFSVRRNGVYASPSGTGEVKSSRIIGTLSVVSVSGGSALCEVQSKSGDIKPGDIVVLSSLDQRKVASARALNPVPAANSAAAPVAMLAAGPQLPTSAQKPQPSRALPNAPTAAPQSMHAPTVIAPPGQTSPCVQPAKLFSPRDYSGPMKRFVGYFTRKPEMTSVPHGGGAPVCSLNAGQKFMLFTKTTIEPVTFVGAGFNAGISQWKDNDPTFGQGAEGYGKRYGAAFADAASRNFFGKFLYPAIFRQDPRYFRSGSDSVKNRFGHAIKHTFVARSDSGGNSFNFSLWMGTASQVALGNLYHPGHSRGFGPAAGRFGAHMGTSAGMDVLKEFWPDVVRALHLPFKERQNIPKGVDAGGN